MNSLNQIVQPGTLYVVATPIGNLQDIGLRAIKVLQEADVIAAEDTRHSRYLLDHFAIKTPTFSLHEHNEQQRTAKIIDALSQGQSIALISDAGTPLISDPGFHLVRAVRAEGYPVLPIPGACALIAALSVAGLPTDHFIFEGFLPVKSSARQKLLNDLGMLPHTLVCYEAPHRILDLLEDVKICLGDHRKIVIARELTKTYETIYHGNVAEILWQLKTNPQQQKGEFVVLIHGAEKMPVHTLDAATEKLLSALLEELPLKQAVRLAAKITDIKKNLLYDWALEKKQRD